MREPHDRDHHHPPRLIRGLAAALVALVAASPAAAAHFAALPSPAAPLSSAPPLGAGAAASVESVRHRVNATTRVDVAVDRAGAPFRIVATQRLDVRVLGDYFFTIGAPVQAATPTPDSASQPGARANSIVWAGFNPGRRILGVRARLNAAEVAQYLPLRVTVENGTTVLRNETGVDAGAFTADAVRAPVLAYLLGLRRTVAQGELPVGTSVSVRSTPVAARLHVVAPLLVEGTIGGHRVSTLLRTQLRIPATGAVRLTVTPEAALGSKDVSTLDGRALLALAIRSTLTVARTRQYQAFLGNPDPTGRIATTYVYRTTERSTVGPVHRFGPRQRNWTTTLLVAFAAVLALGAAVVVWSRS